MTMSIAREKLAGRLYAAMRRISRQRWVSPDDLYQISLRLALCKERNMQAAIAAVLCAFQSSIDIQDCTAVGMIHGIPPFKINHHGYKEFRGFIDGKKNTGMKPLQAELRILQLQLKGISNGN